MLFEYVKIIFSLHLFKMRFDNKKRVFMLKKYHQLRSSLKVQQASIKEFPLEKPPRAATILDNVKKIEETGSVHNLPHVVAKVNKKRELAKIQLTNLIKEFPKLSLRKAGIAVGMSIHSGNSIGKSRIAKITIFNRMVPLHTKPRASKTISSRNLVIFSWTRKNGLRDPPILTLVIFFCGVI